jgi:hypothetical protein
MRIKLFIFFLLLSGTVTLLAQQQNIVKNQGIVLPVHQANVGSIRFTSDVIAVTDLKQTDFLSSYELTNKSNLFITVFMGNSLTNYLYRLAPHLIADTLTKYGNYQFTFYVDNKQIYQSNLHPGAPYAAIKIRKLSLTSHLLTITSLVPGGASRHGTGLYITVVTVHFLKVSTYLKLR